MRLLILAGLCAGALAHPAAARLTELRVLAEEPFAGGAAFGDAGPYVRIRATALGELDPVAPANAGIALLDQAPRNARGMVEYNTDVFILRPADPARGSGVLLYDVTNRGNKFLMSWVNDAVEGPAGSINDPRTAADAGNAFTFRRGATMAWSGWQPEASTANAGMTIRVPVATDGPNPIIRRIRHEFVNGTRGPEGGIPIRLPYPVADMDTARLQVRSREADPRMDVPPDAWGFRDSQTIQLLPFGTTPTPRRIYDFTYDAIGPTVNGIGFAATRDLVAHLRQQDGIKHTLALGISLSGRFLRHFQDLGMNRDEAGRRVFDGVLPHISGAGKVFANEAFAMPFRTATQHEDRFYPEVWGRFGYSGGPGGALLRGDGTDPLVIETNTATEYWQKGASLVHGGPDGADGVLPDGVKLFDRLTGAQLITYAGLLRGMDRETVAARTSDLLVTLDLAADADTLVVDYSAGMSKKIALACALVHAPRLLVLDEPFEAVDPVSAANIRDILTAYARSGGTVIVSSHVMDLVQRMCDHVAVIAAGHVLVAGPVDEVRAGETLEDRFVELVGGRSNGEGLAWLRTSSDSS